VRLPAVNPTSGENGKNTTGSPYTSMGGETTERPTPICCLLIRSRASEPGFLPNAKPSATGLHFARFSDALVYTLCSENVAARRRRGIRTFKLRLPARLLSAETTKVYCDGNFFASRRKGDHVVLTFNLEEEPGDEWEEGAGQLTALLAVRTDLARGDRRALYLGWLLGVLQGACDSDMLEPPVPPGLGQLSASLDSLVEFLHIDRDLVAVAAEASGSSSDGRPEVADIAAWLATQPAGSKDEWLARLVLGVDPALPAEMLQLYLARRTPSSGPIEGSNVSRTAGELLRSAEARRVERTRIAAEKSAAEKARRAREAAAVRAQHLDSLAGREPQLWRKIEDLVATRLPKDYDETVRLLVDLRDLSARGDSNGFQTRLDGFRSAHARKPSLLTRLKQAGL